MTGSNARASIPCESMTGGLIDPYVIFAHCDFCPQATEVLQGHLDQTRFLESKEMRGALELQDSPDRKDGLGTQGPRASPV